MTIPAIVTKNILDMYGHHILSGKKHSINSASNNIKTEDTAIISEEGKKKMMERLKNEAIEHLVSKG
ncbi:MAG: hypothetical protein HZB80_02880 [Deltaproteobacteria bacterium]|nr:hypothetical protein [Deltaproteobacteria bacterium]